MKNVVRKITISVFTYLMMALMGLWITNQTLFVHTHQLENGALVSHAHPYDKSADNPFKSHTHSHTALTFLVDGGLLFPILFLCATYFPILVDRTIPILSTALYSPVCILLPIGRAPPLL